MTTEIKPGVIFKSPDHSLQYIIRCAIRTPDNTILETKHRHDFRTHFDVISNETYVLDGCGYYYRTSINKVPAESLMVTTDDPFEEQRKVPFWKSYGPTGELYPDGVLLALQDMSDLHLEAIMRTQRHIKGTAVEQMFINEIEYRKTNEQTI